MPTNVCTKSISFQTIFDCSWKNSSVEVCLLVMEKKIPKNFSWVDETKHIAALAYPEREDLAFLVGSWINLPLLSFNYTVIKITFYLLDNKIRYLVTLTKEAKPSLDDFELVGIDISVDDYCTFSLEQVQIFIGVCSKALEEHHVSFFVFKYLHFLFTL